VWQKHTCKILKEQRIKWWFLVDTNLTVYFLRHKEFQSGWNFSALMNSWDKSFFSLTVLDNISWLNIKKQGFPNSRNSRSIVCTYVWLRLCSFASKSEDPCQQMCVFLHCTGKNKFILGLKGTITLLVKWASISILRHSMYAPGLLFTNILINEAQHCTVCCPLTVSCRHQGTSM
jgi:hypothetical protein